MLSRRGLVPAAAVLAVLSGSGTAWASDGPGTGVEGCGLFVCVEADAPGTAAGSKPARRPGTDQAKGRGKGPVSGMPCTYKLADPQPPAGSVEWGGHEPGDGAVYEKTCAPGDDATAITQLVWAADPPEEQVDPAVVAQQAVDKMLLSGPRIGITPKPGGKGVVGMPVYLWTTKSASTYGPNTASATAGSVTVTATAKVSKIVWSMGDGSSVTCTTAGTPYRAEYGKKPSPDCGHRYTRPSSTRESGKYHVTATSTWTIDWTGGGESGQLTEIRDSAVDVTVAEVQVLN
ncbi:ATP/GTP-binding protein [Streptomyces sp. ML-6]|uniref:ATP/GTP-binding protein n=1 Tax=Streptomyces sp. ML-6 TaxID=2982693 RepID=UPI0024BF6BEF|nr:ATP/GTP-binding protein [Streptomyces sp. ML-6]MDK0524812.1 ATP/GTP-binding protein [Streptomyces sp. ML-6]